MKKLFKINKRKGKRFLVLSHALLNELNSVDYYAGAHYLGILLSINSAQLAPEHTIAFEDTSKHLTYSPTSVDPNTITHQQYLCIKWLLAGFRELDTDIITGIRYLDYGVKQIVRQSTE
jgi:hypothetical protein